MAKWAPGQSGNPAGRPRRGQTISEALRGELAQPWGEDGTPQAVVLARFLIRPAIDGAIAAAKLVIERTEGPATAPPAEPETGDAESEGEDHVLRCAAPSCPQTLRGY